MRKLIAVGAMMLIDTFEKAAQAVGPLKSAPYDAAFRLQQVKNPGPKKNDLACVQCLSWFFTYSNPRSNPNLHGRYHPSRYNTPLVRPRHASWDRLLC
jgi:hypothetical protein